MAGSSRTAPGDVVEPYAFTSETFEVRPWDGLTVDEVLIDDGAVRVDVGPSTTELFEGRQHAYGPIDYPNGWDWDAALPSVADQRLKTEKGTFGEFGERVYYRHRAGTDDDQSYCIFCRFHPWQESGAPAVGTVTVERRSGRIDRWPAVADRGGLVAVPPGRGDALRPGDRVRVEPGDLLDTWDNTNRTGSTEVVVAAPGR